MDNSPDLIWDTSEYENEDSQEFGWECLTDELTHFIQRVHPDGDWYARVENFGWQSLDGEQKFSAGDGVRLLRAILPNTACTFKVWLDEKEKKITINNAHHDKPTGGEIYTITPQGESS